MTVPSRGVWAEGLLAVKFSGPPAWGLGGRNGPQQEPGYKGVKSNLLALWRGQGGKYQTVRPCVGPLVEAAGATENQGVRPHNKANAADCPSWVFSEGVLPVTVSQIGVKGAGEVHFYRRGVLCSASFYGIGIKGSR